jgi:hypothetical protein
MITDKREKSAIICFFSSAIICAIPLALQRLIRKGCFVKESTKTGGETMEDKRIFERFLTRMPLRFLDLDLSQEGLAEIEDVSAKGIGFTTGAKLKPETALELWLQVPDKGEPIYCRGKVAWAQPADLNQYRVGVSLEQANLIGLSRILRLSS